MKRNHSSGSEQSFVTAESRIEDGQEPTSLRRGVSPPPKRQQVDRVEAIGVVDPPTAAVEAGEATVEDHVAFFSLKLLAARLPSTSGTSRILHKDWLDLYTRNLNEKGHHFVVHQHDHPIAGVSLLPNLYRVLQNMVACFPKPCLGFVRHLVFPIQILSTDNKPDSLRFTASMQC